MGDDHRKSKTGKRRSSFVPARISIRNHESSTASELCKQIPLDLTPSDRLCRLVRLTLKRTLDHLQREFEDLPGIETFNVEALEQVDTALSRMEQEGVFESAVETGRCLPNPINTQMDTTIAELEGSIKRLQQESTKWDALTTELQQKVQEANHFEQLEVATSDLPSDVQEMAQEYLQELPDMNAMTADVCNMIKTTSLLIDDYRHDVSRLQQANTLAHNLRTSFANNLNAETSSGICNPQDLISTLISISK
ncbi:uncharacterized protein LOC112574172 [Pomacea canaliculata]|uniref:uncharacterized protein LOC112574172 n=1 Tax=Pomacea canaliculata TaxID=400727 RepID=UPI000D72944C|nr:uncharacterized protein LOC112574172 [Pomacea canaliculata]XP_025110847.1 uncharacterized protein LOC112574172 [Pomacea canaliculata]